MTGLIHSISSDYAPILQGSDGISDVKRMMREFGVEHKSGHLKIDSTPAFLNILNSTHKAVLNLTEKCPNLPFCVLNASFSQVEL